MRCSTYQAGELSLPFIILLNVFLYTKYSSSALLSISHLPSKLIGWLVVQDGVVAASRPEAIRHTHPGAGLGTCCCQSRYQQ